MVTAARRGLNCYSLTYIAATRFTVGIAAKAANLTGTRSGLHMPDLGKT